MSSQLRLHDFLRFVVSSWNLKLALSVIDQVASASSVELCDGVELSIKIWL